MMEFVEKRKIDNLGRFVLPKQMRERYELFNGSTVKIVPVPEGILIMKNTPDNSNEEKSPKNG